MRFKDPLAPWFSKKLEPKKARLVEVTDGAKTWYKVEVAYKNGWRKPDIVDFGGKPTFLDKSEAIKMFKLYIGEDVYSEKVLIESQRLAQCNNSEQL